MKSVSSDPGKVSPRAASEDSITPQAGSSHSSISGSEAQGGQAGAASAADKWVFIDDPVYISRPLGLELIHISRIDSDSEKLESSITIQFSLIQFNIDIG